MSSALALQTLLQESLSRFGAVGEVRVEERRAVLSGPGPEQSVDVGMLLDQWADLSDELRQRRCRDTIRTLVAQRRSMAAPAGGRGRSRIGPPLAVGAFVAAAAVAAVFWMRRDRNVTPAPTPSASAIGPPADAARSQRALAVCSATRSRVMRGATVSAADTEGWRIDLVLLSGTSKPPVVPPDIVRRSGPSTGRVVWPPVTSLLQAAQTGDLVLQSLPHPTRSGLRLTFSGAYTAAYFKLRQRIDYFRMGAALMRTTGAQFGALFARCAGTTATNIGSWFAGQDASHATGALLFFMGALADPPTLTPTVLGKMPLWPPNAPVLDGLTERAAKVRERTLKKTLGRDGGMVTREDDLYTITFPFKDSNRASRAAHRIASALGVGVRR